MKSKLKSEKYGQYGRKGGWKVKRYEKYGRKLMKSEMIWTKWKKGKLNCEKDMEYTEEK